MSQYVNFLKSIQKPKEQLPGKWVMLGITLTFIAFVVAALFLRGYQYIKNQGLVSAQKAHQEAVISFQKIAAAYPLFASDTPLVTKVAEFEKRLREKEAHFDELTHKTWRQPFSKYMRGLSQAVPEGLWLTHFDINQSSGNISLAGLAEEPIMITIFLKNLQSAPPFAGETFDLFAIKKITTSGLHQFEVANDQLIHEDKENDKK